MLRKQKLSLILMLVLAGIGSKTFAQTTVVIGDNFSAGEYSSFYYALQAIHGMTDPGQVTILLTKDTEEYMAVSLSEDDDIVLKNDSGTSHSMIFRNVTSPNCAISVPDGSTLTIGGGNNPIIIRASQNTNNGAYFYSQNSYGYSDNAGVLIKVAGGTLNINDNVELCYGDNVIWMKKEDSSSPVSPVVNMHGGVIHSATNICVNIADGTFNMDGGYICGHYFTGGDVVPDLTLNPLLDYEKLRHQFGHDSQEDHIEKNGIKDYLTSEDAYNTEYSDYLNRAMGVLVQKNSGTEAAPSTKFNMSGGAICGIYGDGGHISVIDGSYTYNNLEALAVWVDKSEFDFSGGRIYACCAGTDGPGIKLTNSDFRNTQSEYYDWGHVNMSGTASVSYCQSALNGGGVRVEQGVTFTMSGGEISHCVTSADDFTGNGGGGGVRMVSSKFVMSGDAEICYNYSTGTVEAYNGGGIAAVWQSTFGNFHTKLELNGGKIHHNHADSYGGGVVATDKGQGGENSGIDVTFNGVEIYGNTSETHGGGVYVGGSADFEIKGNTKIHDNTTNGSGGGMYVSSIGSTGGHIGSVSASACEIYNNQAENGGGIYADNAYVYIHEGAQVYGHEIAGNGGGVCVMSNANYTQDGGNIGIDGNPNKAANGGGVYVGGTGSVIIGGTGSIKYNEASSKGGGAFLEDGSITMTDGSIDENKATSDGGGFYVSNGNAMISGGNITNNKATSGNGGGFYSAGGTVNVTNATISGNHADNGNGGGLYSVAGITVGQTETGTGATVSGNHAKNGAGFYVAGASGSVTTIQTGSVISGNSATVNGAGAYIASGNLMVNSSTVKGNQANSGNGGGFYVGNGTLTLSGGTIGANGEANHALNGGGVYADGGDVNISNGTIQYNTATTNGGGVYANGGEINISNGYIQYNTATTGGGFYVQGGESTIVGGVVQYNEATNGGGLYMQGTNGTTGQAMAYFSSGSFQNNVAAEAAGGIYVAEYAYLEMSGASNITDNNVPSGKKGGGVLIDKGTMKVMGGTGSSINVYGNYAGEIANRNNVYLNGHDDYITIDGEIDQSVLIGISVSGVLPKPVLYSATPANLTNIYTKMLEYYDDPEATIPSGIFDDAHKYSPLYLNLPPTFTTNYIYFVSTWFSEIVGNIPGDFALDDIDSPEDLASFMFLANCTENGYKNEGKITADIDMSRVLWVPIGEFHDMDPSFTYPDAKPFEGTLEGNGHVISGLNTEGLTNFKYHGLFGRTKGATISNIVLTDCNFVSGEAKRMGCLIGEMDGGTVKNCVVGGTVNVSGSESQPNDAGICNDEFYCVAGGLVGETKGTTEIKNCISTAEVIATVREEDIHIFSQKYTVGGLVGKTSDLTTIENGFANALIQHDGKTVNNSTIPYFDVTDGERFVGGLVGYNEGTLTNCYVRLERGVTVSYDMSKFGMFAGYNDGTIDYCYAPDEDLFANHTYVHTTNLSTLTNYGDYDAVVCPYTYEKYNKDNLVTMTGAGAASGSLLDKLNAWVDTPSTSKDAPAISYSHWMRTSASPINGDYPVLSFDNPDGTLDYTTVGSKDGIQLEYGHSVNTMIERFNGYADGGSLYIYKTPGEMQTSRDGDPTFTGETITEANEANVNIYLQQDVALKNDVDLQNVNPCVVLDNSEAAGSDGDNYYWHMFSTPLTDAPLGINYTGYCAAGSVYGTPSVVNFTNVDGYFPTDTPYGKWDFYCYNEKHSTWINYKRATGDHYDTYTGAPIEDFGNEVKLIPGKGYLAAADTDYKQGLFLQAKGTLSSNANVAATVTCSGHHVTGCNFIGNPYHAYLDFDKFCGENGISSYSVIADGSYVSYAASGSKNPSQASRYIHPHQGFFVKVNAAGTLSFSPDMAVVNQTSSYREAHVDYPLVNLFASDSEGNREVATAELGRPENGGALKIEGMQMGKCTMSISNQGERYGIAFIEGNPEEVAVHFHATEDGDFTMKWNTYNGTFSYLHLIDNLTGMDIDCLSQSEYKFTASTGDYASRFKLKFEFTGVEENEAASAGSSSFAFFHQGGLVVNGQGNLELIDLSGRVLMTKNLGEGQSTVALPEVPEGLYLLRLADDSNVKTQKIIIK